MTEPIINIEVPETIDSISRGALVLDVREVDEWTDGHVQGARHIALGDLPDFIDDLPRDRVIVCVCHLGGRSARAAAFLAEHGFSVRNLDGGMTAWIAADQPIVTGP